MSHRPDDLPRTEASVEDLTVLDRILTLTDQVIGLQAELAEARYRYDLAETALSSAPAAGSRHEAASGDGDLTLQARLATEIELRQGLARQLARERARADEAERQLAQLRASWLSRAERAARSTGEAVRKRWH